MSDVDIAASQAIALARRRGSAEVGLNDLLLGCLCCVSRFGIATLGNWTIDLEGLGMDWLEQPNRSGPKVAYSDAVVALFDLAARIARADGSSSLQLEHLLVAFADQDCGLMRRLKQEFKIESSGWRAALASLSHQQDRAPAEPLEAPARDYLTPEEAGIALGIHVQTVRGYVRSGKLPALRVAGERAIRIRRADLDKVLEPLTPEK